MTLTPSRQRNAVSQGMALGLVRCGHDRIRFDKFRVDLAFEGAWRNWPQRVRFRQVNTDISNGLDGTWAMTRADERKHVTPLFWDTDGTELRICTRDEAWDAGDQDDVNYALGMIDGNVRREEWVALARDFLERLDH